MTETNANPRGSLMSITAAIKMRRESKRMSRKLPKTKGIPIKELRCHIDEGSIRSQKYEMSD
jgi:hypothetical protein